MPFVQKHDPGTFCWLELGTTDRAAAVKFYNELFGWKNQDVPMDQGVYTIFQLKEHDTGAAYELDEEMRKRGIPPHWMLYAAVKDADAAAARVAPLGGKVLMGPFDVQTHGRMAIVQDPQGATFALWQAKEHPGIKIKDEAGTLCWPELNTTDTAAATKFYSGLFGWGQETDKPGDPKAYTEWKIGDRSVGGMMQIQKEWGPVPPHWMPYIQVDDCQATVAKAEKIGAKAIVPTMEIEVGRFATIRDPQGAHFSVFEMRRK
jgi:predicted enzyme related to lactoylglutathione lyase